MNINPELYKRNCPRCGKEIFYKRKGDRNSLEKRGSICNSCSHIGKTTSEDTKKKMSLVKLGRKMSEDIKQKISSTLIGNKRTLGYKHSEETRNKLKNKIISEETREKLRKHRWNQIEKLGVRISNFNPNACKFIDNINNILGLNLQHSMNGGEIKVSWYSLDGYDKEKNIVFEYDEKYHNTPENKKRDLLRQNRIINKIHPSSFLRYDERNNKLYDVITQKEITII